MSYIADLHIHSRFSRACSPEINIPHLAKWAKLKGIDLLGTGDCLHPLWQAELKRDLRELGNGLYLHGGVKFLLTTEVSCIYSDKGKVRRVHLVIFLPSLQSAERLASELVGRRVNLSSDGRPIMGIPAKNLLEIILTVEPKAIMIPAHIWTPWFALFGSKSGYDFLEECFEDLSDKILGIETGNSSDPEMNWRIANLDKKAILSFSDSHSLPNIGREATIFKGGLSYDELIQDIKNHNIESTIEFFPEEGMYHFSGHRNCNIVLGPEEIKRQGVICPICGKGLTIGVVERIEALASRATKDLELITDNGLIKTNVFPKRPGFRKLVQLRKIIGDAFGMGDCSKKVQTEYFKLVEHLDSELNILTKTSLGQIQALSSEEIAEGIGRVREGKVEIQPGYDGVYGKIIL